MYQKENEVSINLADMFAHILHHWKLILILSIALMALVGGLMTYKEYREVQNKYEESTYSAMIANMTDAQIETVEQFYSRYTAYKERIADNQYYVDNSLRMKLDANNIFVLTREYLRVEFYSHYRWWLVSHPDHTAWNSPDYLRSGCRRLYRKNVYRRTGTWFAMRSRTDVYRLPCRPQN